MGKKTHIVSLIGILFGVVILVLALVYHGDAASGSSADSYTSFGADFYTYSYQATAKATNNIRLVLQAVQDGFFYLLLALGLTDIAYFSVKTVQYWPKAEKVTCTDNDAEASEPVSPSVGAPAEQEGGSL